MSHHHTPGFTVTECPHGDASPYSCPPCQNEALLTKGASRAKFGGTCRWDGCFGPIVVGSPIEFLAGKPIHAYHH